jgi:protein-disulfide isomerase
MNAARRQRVIFLWLMILVLLAACAPAATPRPVAISEQPMVPTNLNTQDNTQYITQEESDVSPTKFPDPGTEVPVTPDDPAWGNPWAPVTMVIWADYECPFCSRLMGTLALLQEQYGPEQLRVVWKHNPQPFHKNAYGAHVAAETVLRLGGVKAFWNFHALLFRNQRSLDTVSFIVWATACGVDPRAFELALDQQTFAVNVDNDLALGKKLGVKGTPASFINGIFVLGAQPFAVFEKAIDAQIRQADKLRRAGVPEKRIYAQLSDQNRQEQQVMPPRVFTPPPSGSSGLSANQNQRFGAKHLVVMYGGSMRAPAGITRTKAEALARAQEALRRLRAGANFEDIVVVYSDEPGAGQRGGDLGTFPRGAMVPEFQNAVENIGVGNVSEVVETPFGYHIILRTQ